MAGEVASTPAAMLLSLTVDCVNKTRAIDPAPLAIIATPGLFEVSVQRSTLTYLVLPAAELTLTPAKFPHSWVDDNAAEASTSMTAAELSVKALPAKKLETIVP